MPLFALIGGALELGKTWLEGRVERSKAKTEAAASVTRAKGQAEAKVMISSAETEDKWTLIQARNAQSSWKDEAILLVLLGIIVANFVPGMQPYLQTGWDNLSRAPEWFAWSFMAAVGASFGVKGWGAYTKWKNK